MWFLGTHRQDELKDEEIQRAFNVAYALHPDKLIACVVTSDGYDRIPFIRQMETKRRKSDRAFKMPTPNEALPQVGVFYASDVWERNQENEIEKKEPVYEPTAHDKIVRYIKHIVMNTMHRDSGNVVVGLGCLLYTFSPSKLCNLAPDLFDDTNIRRDKRRIANSLKVRFSNESTNITLKPADDAESTLAMKSLRIMAPWVQPHYSYSGRASNLLETCFHRDAAPLDWIRNHMLIDPECCGISHLIHEYNDQLPLSGVEMRLDNPENKLSVPIFNGGKSNSNDRYLPPTLSPQDTYFIRESLERNRSRRKSFVSSHIRVCVDGKETARFNASAGESHPFHIANTASYIEVFGKDEYGDLLLAFFPLSSLDCFDLEEPLTLRVQVEGGQETHCLIYPAIDSNDEITSSLAQIKYQASKLNAAFIRDIVIANGWELLRLWSPRVVLTLLLLIAWALHVGEGRQNDGKRSQTLIKSIQRDTAGKLEKESPDPPVLTPAPPTGHVELSNDRRPLNSMPTPQVFAQRRLGRPPSGHQLEGTLILAARITLIPDGTVLIVEMDSNLNSGTAQVSDRFLAHIATPVVDAGGRTLLQSGTIVEGHIASVKKASLERRSGELGLSFDYIEFGDGRKLPLRATLISGSNPVDEEGDLVADAGVGDVDIDPGERFNLEMVQPLSLRSTGHYGDSYYAAYRGARTGARQITRPVPLQPRARASTSTSANGLVLSGDPNSIRTQWSRVPVYDVRADRDRDGLLRVLVTAETPTSGWRIYTNHEVQSRDTLDIRLMGIPPSQYGAKQISHPSASAISLEDRNSEIRRILVRGQNGDRYLTIGQGTTSARLDSSSPSAGSSGNSPPSAPSTGNTSSLATQTTNQVEALRSNYAAAIGLWINSDGTVESLGGRRTTATEMQLYDTLSYLLTSAKSLATPSLGTFNRQRAGQQLQRDSQTAQQMWQRVKSTGVISQDLDRQWQNAFGNLRALSNAAVH